MSLGVDVHKSEQNWRRTVSELLYLLANPGANGQVLTSTGTDLEWQDGAGSTLTTRGDLLTRDASGLARLAVGASGTFLSSDGTDPSWKVPTLTKLTNSLAADVLLNNTGSYFTGPQVAQGTRGVWLAVGAVNLQDPGGATVMRGKLWDGTTVVDSFHTVLATNQTLKVSVSGIFTSPAGNIRISVNDVNLTTGKIIWTGSGNQHDSTLTVIRIG